MDKTGMCNNAIADGHVYDAAEGQHLIQALGSL